MRKLFALELFLKLNNFPLLFKFHHYSLKGHQVTLFSYISQSKSLHTAKGWKILARTGQKSLNKENDNTFDSCEEGTNAISHTALIYKLQSCNTVSEQIKKFSSIISLTDEEKDSREAFCDSLRELFKPYFSRFKVYQFGSSVNGLGFKGCDLDICMQTIFEDNKVREYIKLSDVPIPDDVLQGKVSNFDIAHLNSINLLRFIRRIFRRDCPDIKEPILLIKAKCPILRFYNAKYDVFCDFSCEHKHSLINTKLIRLICNMDERFAPLAKLIRYWGKYGGFVGDIEQFNSYSFTLLIVYFLQNTTPPVLPSIKFIVDKSVYLKNGAVDDVDLMLQDINNFEKSHNTKSVEELLREYFFYFLYYDFSRVLQPLSASSIHKIDFKSNIDSLDTFEFSPITVQDPFQHSFNTTAAALYKACKSFLNGLVFCCNKYQDKSSWNPNNPNWGICSLFESSFMDKSKIMNENDKYTIEIALNNGIENLVKKIFEHCLLFNIKEFITDSPTKENIFKFSCLVYYNTWQGRTEVIREKNFDVLYNDPLEIEHLISKELIKQNSTKKRNLLFSFHCECKEKVKNDNVVLLIDLNVCQSKFPPVVAIFLKEYIPLILSKYSEKKFSKNTVADSCIL